MVGRNQQGPDNKGPMSGRGLGICKNNVSEDGTQEQGGNPNCRRLQNGFGRMNRCGGLGGSRRRQNKR